MCDLLNEDRLTMGELARQEELNPCTIWRWTGRGVKGVRLETFSIGGRRFTTKQAFQRFVAATTAAANGQTAVPTSRTNRQREAAISKAEAELAKAGI
jgi:hypothetical protein